MCMKIMYVDYKMAMGAEREHMQAVWGTIGVTVATINRYCWINPQPQCRAVNTDGSTNSSSAQWGAAIMIAMVLRTKVHMGNQNTGT